MMCREGVLEHLASDKQGQLPLFRKTMGVNGVRIHLQQPFYVNSSAISSWRKREETSSPGSFFWKNDHPQNGSGSTVDFTVKILLLKKRKAQRYGTVPIARLLTPKREAFFSVFTTQQLRTGGINQCEAFVKSEPSKKIFFLVRRGSLCTVAVKVISTKRLPIKTIRQKY